MTDEIARLVELSERGLVEMRIAEGTEDTSFERASAFATETYFRAVLAKWFRAHQEELKEGKLPYPNIPFGKVTES